MLSTSCTPRERDAIDTDASSTLAAATRARIAAAFARAGGRDASAIRIDVEDGRATLSGTVRHWADRCTAGRAAAGVPGIRNVDNQLALLVKGRAARR